MILISTKCQSTNLEAVVTAIRALATSSGYVQVTDVVPAPTPARNRRRRIYEISLYIEGKIKANE